MAQSDQGAMRSFRTTQPTKKAGRSSRTVDSNPASPELRQAVAQQKDRSDDASQDDMDQDSSLSRLGETRKACSYAGGSTSEWEEVPPPPFPSSSGGYNDFRHGFDGHQEGDRQTVTVPVKVKKEDVTAIR